MTTWLADDEHAQLLPAKIHHLMRSPRGDLQPLTRRQEVLLALHFHRHLPFEYIKELPSHEMMMALLFCCRWQCLLNNAQLCGIH